MQEATTYGDFSMSVKQIERVHEFTYLGIIFDECLSWGSHVKKVISKAGCEGTEDCSEIPRHQTVSVSDCFQRTA